MRKHFSFRFIKKCLIIAQIILIGCFITYNMSVNSLIKQKKHPRPLNLTYVTVHLDLKGAPPKLIFLKKMLRELKMLGANALLIEYEDMFPYQKQLVNLSRREHYSRRELKHFLKEVNDLGFEVIPLIQIFGHMESVLKLKEFQDLREDAHSVTSICPSKLKSKLLIREMLKQVIEFHNSVVPLKRIHIGCDEVFQINTCGDCKKRNLKTVDIYTNHVDKVANMIINMCPNIKILIWDDMLRRTKVTHWNKFKINPNVEIVYWWYKEFEKPIHFTMYLYHKHFRNIWVASAFKGADGENAVVPNYEKRTNNILSWLRLIDNYVFAGEQAVYPFKGIILTGWSRYEHFFPLCELLPVSYKSLITGLLLVNKFRNGSRIDDIDWKEDWNAIFNKHFLTDYYEQVGYEGLENDSFVLEPANSLYNSVERYDTFIKNMSRKLTLDVSWCHAQYEKLTRILETDLKLKLRPFYDVKIQKEIINSMRNSAELYSHLQKCFTLEKKRKEKRN